MPAMGLRQSGCPLLLQVVKWLVGPFSCFRWSEPMKPFSRPEAQTQEGRFVSGNWGIHKNKRDPSNRKHGLAGLQFAPSLDGLCNGFADLSGVGAPPHIFGARSLDHYSFDGLNDSVVRRCVHLIAIAQEFEHHCA